MRTSERRKAFITLARKRVRPGSGSHPAFLGARTVRVPIVDLQRLIRDTPFVVVGGVATRLYMPERSTLDIDVLVRAVDLPKLEHELGRAGAQKLGDLSIGGSSWRLPDGTVLDVIASSAPWVEPALAQPRQGPEGLPYADLPYLILLKLQASRAQDLADVSRMLGAADPQAIERVRAAVQRHLPEAAEDLESLIALGKLELSGSEDAPPRETSG
jgi:hypothetical protein